MFQTLYINQLNSILFEFLYVSRHERNRLVFREWLDSVHTLFFNLMARAFQRYNFWRNPKFSVGDVSQSDFFLERRIFPFYSQGHMLLYIVLYLWLSSFFTFQVIMLHADCKIYSYVFRNGNNIGHWGDFRRNLRYK